MSFNIFVYPLLIKVVDVVVEAFWVLRAPAFTEVFQLDDVVLFYHSAGYDI